MVLLGGLQQDVADNASALADHAETTFFRLLDLLRTGDKATWAAAVFVAFFVVLLVGVWRGTISFGRKS